MTSSTWATLQTRRCGICGKDRPFKVILRYRYWGLYWVFNCVTKKKYMLLCDVCHRGRELESREVERVMRSVPIPFMRRFGLLVLVWIIVALAVLGSVWPR